jgi:hypothetical protein
MSEPSRLKQVCCRVVLVFPLLTTLSNCAEKTFIAEVKNGVRYVHNIKPAYVKPAVGLLFVRKIGELESKDPDFQFVRPMSADEDSAGNLFILDDKESCVKKFSAERKFMGRFGRAGQGPGEFEYPTSVKVAADGRLVVSTMSSEFHIFENDGTFIGQFRLPRYRGINPAVFGSDHIVAYAFQVDGENNRDNHVLVIFDFKGQVLQEFGEPFLLDSARRTWDANFLSLAVDAKGNIYVAFHSLNRIEKYSPAGRLLLSIDRLLPYEIEHRYEKTTMDIGGRTATVDQPSFTPVNRDLGIDSHGRAWVLSFQKAVPSSQVPKDYRVQDYLAFEVYGKDGVLLSRVPFPPGVVKFDNMTMRGDHVFFVDPFDEACVYEYAVTDRDDRSTEKDPGRPARADEMVVAGKGP